MPCKQSICCCIKSDLKVVAQASSREDFFLWVSITSAQSMPGASVHGGQRNRAGTKCCVTPAFVSGSDTVSSLA